MSCWSVQLFINFNSYRTNIYLYPQCRACYWLKTNEYVFVVSPFQLTNLTVDFWVSVDHCRCFLPLLSFLQFTSSKKLDGYNQRKYVWKMVYIHMLGYEVDFGALEVINLITSTKFVEKSAGYMATSILLNQAPDLMELIHNALRNDMISGNHEAKSLALQCVANMGNPDLANTVSPIVYDMLTDAEESANVRKKAALCLLRVLRATQKPCPEKWYEGIFNCFNVQHIGLLMASSSLILSLASRNAQKCLPVVGRTIMILETLVVLKNATYDYVYYQTPAPWLQVKLFKILQFFPVPKDAQLKTKLFGVVNKVMWKVNTVWVYSC